MKRVKYNPDLSHTFDLECTTTNPAVCWLAASTPLSDASLEATQIFYNIYDVVKYIFQNKHKEHRFFAHNLGYDMSFILAHLRDVYPEEFTIDNLIHPPMGGMMSITITLRGIKIYFYDTVVKFAAPLSSVLATYTNMEKGETPIYEQITDVIYNDYNEKYCKIDACGLAQALPIAMESGTSLTLPSDAYKRWAAIMTDTHTRRGFSKRYPAISLNLDKEMREAYRGGFTFGNPSHLNKILNNVKVFDVNSMYPAQMRFRELPYGAPCVVLGGKVKPRGKFKLGIQRITFTSAEIKIGKCPFIATKKGFRGSNQYGDYIAPAKGSTKCRQLLTLDELELFLDHYHVEDLRFDGGWMFQSSTEDFATYIDEHWEMKCSPDAVEKNRGKLFLNSLYGKFAESPDKEVMAYDFDDEVLVCRPTGEIESKPKGYLPLGIFITSYARCQLIEAIQIVGYENFVYCDTDSIHVLPTDNTDKLDLHPSRLGAWDFEGEFVQAKYIRAKRYMGISEDGSKKVVCAGINKKDLKDQVLNLDDFYEGRLINTRKFKNGNNGKYVKPQTTRI